MATLSQFFYPGDLKQQAEIWLDDATSRHIAQVLRMQPGGQVQLTNGRGYTGIALITIADKKKCRVVLQQVKFQEEHVAALHLAIAFTKNSSRNEWLLEKATELGARSIIPLQTTRTEKDKIRYDRWQNILVSALLQSQQYYLPHMPEIKTLQQVVDIYRSVPQKLVAHCIDEYRREPLQKMLKMGEETVLLIGPEGDFTQQEVTLCTEQGFKSISLGTQRLRTETAAMAACAYFNLINNG